MKKIISLILVLALVLAFAGCGAVTTLPTDENDGTQIPNPWQEVDTVADAKAILGYDIAVPETVAGLAQTAVRVLNDSEKILEIYYGGETEGADHAVIRKAPGTDDISGDYTDYAEVKDVTVGELTVTEKGDGTSVFSAVWTKDGYSYSFFSTAGVSADDFAAIAAAVA